MTNEPCTDCRIAISPKGIEVDNSGGDLLLEAGRISSSVFTIHR